MHSYQTTHCAVVTLVENQLLHRPQFWGRAVPPVRHLGTDLKLILYGIHGMLPGCVWAEDRLFACHANDGQ